MKVIYMGTPDFAVAPLEKILELGHEVILVVTQPDRPKGRSKEPVPSPVKECAIKHGIPVFQPERIKRPENVEFLRNYKADICVVTAFGQILSKEILDLPRLGCVNIHASLLPKYRGSSPIQNVILDGEKETGITVMQMNEGCDTGDILYVKKYVLTPEETFETLHDALAVLGGEAIYEALPLIEKGELAPIPQNEAESTHVSMITKEMGRLDFTKSAAVLDCQIRGMNPWPSAYTFMDGKQVKIFKAKIVNEAFKGCAPGEIVEVAKDSFTICCGEGALRIYELQLEGKKRMSTEAFLLGAHIGNGTKLG